MHNSFVSTRMLDLMIFAVTSILIGLVSLSLFIVAFYLYRQSRRVPSAHESTEERVAQETSAAKLKSGDFAAADIQAVKNEEAESETSSSTCDYFNQELRKNRQSMMQQQMNSTGSEASLSDLSPDYLYTCKLCGSCCAGDDQPSLSEGGAVFQMSPISMAPMRRAVREPISQMEGVLETSTSTSSSGRALMPTNLHTVGDVTNDTKVKGDSALQMEEET